MMLSYSIFLQAYIVDGQYFLSTVKARRPTRGSPHLKRQRALTPRRQTQDIGAPDQRVEASITEATLRWWIFHTETNGLKPALLKIGGRVYIDRAEFNKWLEDQRMAPTPLKTAA